MTRHFLVRTVVTAMLMLALPVVAHAAEDRSTKPVLLVHGFDLVGPGAYHCEGYWRTTKGRLQLLGWTAPMPTVAYYGRDNHCKINSSRYGSHRKVRATKKSHGRYGHAQNTPIQHLGYHLAWTVYERYSKAGVTVDLVGHSMGGLIIRDALARVAIGSKHYPPYLLVEDAVTMGTPHGGAPGADACKLEQCRDMTAGSRFLTALDQVGANPQGKGGTQWTVMGSDKDHLVPGDSALAMAGAAHRIRYLPAAKVGHISFIYDGRPAHDRAARYSQFGGAEIETTTAPSPIGWLDRALSGLDY